MQTNIQAIQTILADLKLPTQIATPQLASAIMTGEQLVQQLNAHVQTLQDRAARAAKLLEKPETLTQPIKDEIKKLQEAAAAAIAPATPIS